MTSNASMGRSRGMGTTNRSDDARKAPNEEAVRAFVEELFQKANVTGGTTTKGGWCLKEGMTHVLEAGSSTRLLSLVQQKGLPRIYAIVEDATCRHEKETVSLVDQQPNDCFQALCRIIAGQQLAGAAAKSVWTRLRSTANPLTPESILMLVEKGLEEYLRKPAGLSNAKARSIVALSDAFRSGELSEDFLSNSAVTEVELRAKLLAIKGIGPWTCDMFLMFHLEKKSVLPLGDLGVRKGIAKFFQLKGRGPRGTLCDKKDRDVMEAAIAPFSPYQSLVTYYMWAAADTNDLWGDPGTCNDDRKEIIPMTTETPSKTGHSKRTRRIVTP